MTNQFAYTTQTMSSPLKTVRGKVRLDRYGNPLTSIRIKQHPQEKARMIKRMIELMQVYHAMPEYFPDSATYGVDPVSMTTLRVFEDLTDQIVKWQASPSNDIFESFIVRHNALVDHLKQHLMINDPTGSDAAEVELNYSIRQTRNRSPKLNAVVNNNFTDLFKT